MRSPARALVPKLIVLSLVPLVAVVTTWRVAWSQAPEAGLPAAPAGSAAAAPAGVVRIPTPAAPPHVDTGQRDAAGQPITVACSTCHSVRTPDRTRRSGVPLRDFHQGLRVAHGELSCLSCHDADDYDRLRLADGSPLPFPQVMDLCGQCHGPQRRDYDHGAHGGMRGAWDLRRGDRQRNHCVDCHDPHAPAFPRVRPVFAPAKER